LNPPWHIIGAIKFLPQNLKSKIMIPISLMRIQSTNMSISTESQNIKALSETHALEPERYPLNQWRVLSNWSCQWISDENEWVLCRWFCVWPNCTINMAINLMTKDTYMAASCTMNIRYVAKATCAQVVAFLETLRDQEQPDFKRDVLDYFKQKTIEYYAMRPAMDATISAQKEELLKKEQQCLKKTDGFVDYLYWNNCIRHL
jgi:hypothetical protein